MQPGQEVQVKGSAFLSLVQALRTVRGDSVHQRVLDGLPGEAGQALRTNTLLASGWYPMAWYRELLETMRRVTAEGDAITIAVSREGFRRDVTGIYKVFFKLLSPQTLLTQAQKAMGLYYAGGTVRVVESRDCYARAEYANFKGFNRVAWLDNLSAVEEALVLAGARDVQSRVLKGGGDGDAHITVEMTWKPRA